MTPLVSIIVPVYNVEHYLQRCMKSLLEQTYSNLEIILVDDGSTDGSPKLCDKYEKCDARVKVIHKENAGLGMARNTGLENASGKFLFFIDSDDYISLNTVEVCVASALKYKSNIVAFGRNNVSEDGRIEVEKISAKEGAYTGESIVKEILCGMFTYSIGFGISACGKMYARSILLGLDKRFKSEREIVSEDAYFMLDLFSDIKIVSIVPENLYYYCHRDGSLTRTYKNDRQIRNDEFYKKMLELVAERQLSEKVANAIGARYHKYSIAAMKQIITSDINDCEKKAEFDKVFDNKTLRTTLSASIICMEPIRVRLFWLAFKFGMRRTCYTIIRKKTN